MKLTYAYDAYNTGDCAYHQNFYFHFHLLFSTLMDI